MKKALALITLLVLSLQPLTARAQVFYAYPKARPVARAHVAGGPYLAFGDNSLYRGSAFGRIGLARYVDVGIELLIENVDSDTQYGAAIDTKFSLVPDTSAIPFDLSGNVGVGVISGDNISEVQIPIGGIISLPLELESGRLLTPYLGVYLLIVDQDIDLPGGGTVSDTDFDAEIRPGIGINIRPGLDGFAAVHFGRDALFALGLTFEPGQ